VAKECKRTTPFPYAMYKTLSSGSKESDGSRTVIRGSPNPFFDETCFIEFPDN